MKIAFTASGGTWDAMIDPRFGRASFLMVFDEERNGTTFIDNRESAAESHGAGTATAQKLYDLRPDVLITGNGPGDTAARALKHLNMRIFVDAQQFTLQQAYQQYKEGKLREI